MHYYEHHLGDFAAATGHLSWDEDMAYTRLLRAYYHHERPIPEQQAYRLARAATPAQRKAVDVVLAEFFVLVDGAHTQKRADAEIARYQDKQRKAKASADARWSQSARNADGMRTHSEGNADGMPHAGADAMGARPVHTQTHTQPTEAKLPRGRGSRLAPDWHPGDTGMAFAETHGLANGKAAAELERFRDHWTAKTGADASKADWQATWRNWVRRAVEFGPKPGVSRGSDDPFAGAQ